MKKGKYSSEGIFTLRERRRDEIGMFLFGLDDTFVIKV